MTASPTSARRKSLLKPKPPPTYSPVTLLVTVLVVVASFPWLLRVDSRLAAFLLACFLAQCVHGVMRAITAGQRLLSAVFWTFSLCYLAVPAVYQVATQQAAWGDAYLYSNEERLLQTLLITNLAFGAFALGGGVGERQGRTLSVKGDKRSDRRIYFGAQADGPSALTQTPTPRRTYVRGDSPRRARWLAPPGRLVPLAYCGFALLLLPFVIVRTGGVSSLFSSRSERSEALAAAGIGQVQSGGVAVALVGILPGALALAATYVLVLRWRDGQKVSPLSVLLAGGLLFVYANPFANTRYISAVAIFSIVFLIVQPRSRRALAIVVTVLVIGVLGVYPLANAFRGDDTTSQPSSLADGDFDGFQQMVNARQYVEERGQTWGVHLSSAALFPLPRRFWVDKAVPASIPVAENRGYAFTNLSLPFPGELYMEFGVVGTAAGMFIWGVGWRRLERHWAVGTESVQGAMVPYLAIAQLGVLRGPVGSLVPIYAAGVMLLLLALWWRDRPRTSQGVVASRRTSWPGLSLRRRGGV